MRLKRDFFERDPRTVAEELLGKIFISPALSAPITETEAYLDEKDLASHARFGKTKRNSLMWGRGGYLYVYLIYGIYDLANIIAGPEGKPGAVLIRGLKGVKGPGKVARALGITRANWGLDLVESPTLYIEDNGVTVKKVERKPRVGVEYAGEWAEKNWRYIGEVVT